MLKLFLGIAVLVTTATSQKCVPRRFDSDSIVCVCNATYCDAAPNPGEMPPKPDSYYHFVSSKDGLRMDLTVGQIGKTEANTTDYILTVDQRKTYQKIVGFGGAITDSAGLNIAKLSPEAQDKLIKTYFSPTEGSGYNMLRIPIAGTDFSTRAYTYDDYSNDDNLTHFALTDEDHLYKIPYIKKAMKENPTIKFFAAAWSAPPWMKTNNDYTGLGFLKPEYYQLYADYLVKYLDAYKEQGIEHWAISTGNEPMTVYAPFLRINSMGWTPLSQGNWIAENLGPSLERSSHNEIEMMIIDDQRFNLPWFVDKMFKNEKAKKLVSIIALHWYWDDWFSPDRVDQTLKAYPDKTVLMTEACTKPNGGKPVDLGSWSRAEKYIHNIIENLNHYYGGWVDWNLALDEKGGPNWADNEVDSPIIVNSKTDEFYKQPMYYGIRHFSSFLKPDSVRVRAYASSAIIQSCVFRTPDDAMVVVLYNKNDSPKVATVKDQGKSISLNLKPRSINTIIYHK